MTARLGPGTCGVLAKAFPLASKRDKTTGPTIASYGFTEEKNDYTL